MQRLKVKNKSVLKEFLATELSLSARKAKELIDSKGVFVNNRRAWMAGFALKAGDIVEVNLPPPQESSKNRASIEILYEDETVIAVNKPSHMLTNEGKDSLEEVLKDRYNTQVRAIHRLDKDTTGVNLFAKNNASFEAFKSLWAEKSLEKEYWAIAYEEADFENREVHVPIENKSASSFIKTLSSGNGFSLFLVRIETGRKHQIRRHLALIRHPIVGDSEFGPKIIADPALKNVKRQLLHASRIAFVHPVTQSPVDIQAPLPSDFIRFLDGHRLPYPK